MEKLELSNGFKIPMLGYGTFQIPLAKVKQNVSMALKCGYRLIDSAASYLNEAAIGEALKESNIARSELVITSKVWVQDAGYEKTRKAFTATLNKLKLDYLDIYLIHQPFGDYYGSWRALEELYEQGKVKVIGVCNFSPAQLVDLCLNSKIAPMINQIEIHPFFQRNDYLVVMQEYHVLIEAWGPLAEGQRDIFENQSLRKIAQKYHKTIAQVVLRWHFQRGVITIPKTVRLDKMQENLDIFDFALEYADMKLIAGLDLGYSEIIDFHCSTTARCFNEYKIHEEN